MSASALPPGAGGPPGAAPDTDRRNHYRVLQVQPEAPLAVIKASYRTLMTSLRMHPDLGGSHAQAAAINQAYAVLSDAPRRAAYDQWLRRHGHVAPRPVAAAAAAAAGLAATATPAARAAGTSTSTPTATAMATAVAAGAPARPCPLCGLLLPPQPRPPARCPRCHAPQTPLPPPGSQARELLGRRGAARRGKGQGALLHIGWPSPAVPVRWRDLSLSGVGLMAPQALAPGQRIHLIDPALELVAEVVASRAMGAVFRVHARLLSAVLLQPTGVFVSATA